jgi:hypothetical protein
MLNPKLFSGGTVVLNRLLAAALIAAGAAQDGAAPEKPRARRNRNRPAAGTPGQ